MAKALLAIIYSVSSLYLATLAVTMFVVVTRGEARIVTDFALPYEIILVAFLAAAQLILGLAELRKP